MSNNESFERYNKMCLTSAVQMSLKTVQVKNAFPSKARWSDKEHQRPSLIHPHKKWKKVTEKKSKLLALMNPNF